MKEKFIGIEIGGTKLQIVVGDANGKVEQNMRYTVDSSKGAKGIQAMIVDCFDKWKLNFDDIAGIGVGFGGPVNWKSGTIKISHHVDGWQQFNLKEWLETITNKRVVVDNDANVAAFGEAVHGGGLGYEKVFYMTIGSGIGGGIVLNKTIYHGMHPGEVEIGHIRLDKSGATLESKCSGWAVNNKIRDFIEKSPDSLLAQLARKSSDPEAALLKPAMQKGDESAFLIIEEIADDLAFALSHVVHLFHPEIIIIGGGLSLLGEQLRLPIEVALSKYLMKAFLPPPPIQISHLGENVVPIGALELAKKYTDLNTN